MEATYFANGPLSGFSTLFEQGINDKMNSIRNQWKPIQKVVV